MDLRQLQYFLHIAESGSLAVASDRAHVTQPALSRQLRLLEEELGCALFERKPRGLQLTASGHLLRAKASALVGEFRRMREEMRAASDAPHGRLVVAIPPSLRSALTVPALESFRSLYPTVVLHVMEGMSTTSRDAVLSGAADLAVVTDREPSELLSRSRLGWEPLVAIGRAAGLPRQVARTSVSRAELGALPLVISPWPNSLRRIIADGLADAGQPCVPLLEVESSSLALALARRGAAFGVLPRCVTVDLRKSPGVGAWPVEGLRIGWHAVTARDRTATAATRCFLDIVVERAASLVADGIWSPPDDASPSA